MPESPLKQEPLNAQLQRDLQRENDHFLKVLHDGFQFQTAPDLTSLLKQLVSFQQ